jgi:hypothetical protein
MSEIATRLTNQASTADAERGIDAGLFADGLCHDVLVDFRLGDLAERTVCGLLFLQVASSQLYSVLVTEFVRPGLQRALAGIS